MLRAKKRIFAFECLEDRCTPSATALVQRGSLIVKDDVAAHLQITQTDVGTFHVVDGATDLGSFSGVTGAVRVTTSKSDDTIAIDLGGFTTPGDIVVSMGKGNNDFTLTNGIVTGTVLITGSSGDDSAVLGDGVSSLTLARALAVNLDGGAHDSLTVHSGVTLNNGLTTYAVNDILLEAGSSVARSAVFWGGNAGNKIDLGGSIGGDVYFLAPFYAASSLTLESGASVARDLVYSSAWLNSAGNALTVDGTVGRDLYFDGTSKDDVVDIAGTVARNLIASTGNGNDQVLLQSTSVIGKQATVLFGNGNNILAVQGTIGVVGSTSTNLYVTAGNGANTFTVGAAAVVNGSAKFYLGKGANTFDLRDAGTVTGTLTVKGGGGSLSLFKGSTQPNHLTLIVSGFATVNGAANP